MNSLTSFLKNTLVVTLCLSTVIFVSPGCSSQTHFSADVPKLNNLDYFDASGFNMLVFSNWYDVNFFSDSKLSGVEIIHHEVRTATNGDVRLNPAPEQWDPIPKLVQRKVNKQDNSIEASLTYADYDFNYTIKAKAHNEGILLSVNLNKPLPQALVGKAGFNLEFLPSAYFEKAYLMDDTSGTFPLYPDGPMAIDKSGTTEPKPIATGKTLVLAPEDPNQAYYHPSQRL